MTVIKCNGIVTVLRSFDHDISNSSRLRFYTISVSDFEVGNAIVKSVHKEATGMGICLGFTHEEDEECTKDSSLMSYALTLSSFSC